MKNYFIFIFCFLLIYNGQSQVMSQKAQWISIKSNNLRCWECKQKLDNFLIAANNSEFENGVLQRRYNLFTGEIRIQYLPDRVTPDVLRAVINEAGFNADSTKADSEAYKKLPPVCKLPEDGGGPQLRKNCQTEP